MQCSQESLTDYHRADFRWQYIHKIVDNGRKRKTDLRMVVNAILWVTRTGAQWRNIDSNYRSKLPIILYYYYSWQKQGVWEQVLHYLVKVVRQKLGDEPSPSGVALDSQSVKSVPFVCQQRGIDGNKRINGRKRHIVVDKHGFLLAVGVSAANCHDSPEGIELLWKLEQFERLELFCLDKAYKGQFLEALEIYGWQSEIAQKPESQRGFIGPRISLKLCTFSAATLVMRKNLLTLEHVGLSKNVSYSQSFDVPYSLVYKISLSCSKR